MSRLAEENAGLATVGFVSWRALFGALVVAGFIGLRVARGRRVVGWGVLSPRGRASLAVATIAGVALNLAIFTAFQRVTIALALLVFYTYPALVTVVVVVVERRRPDRVQLAALAMATLGMAIVVVGGIDPTTGLTFDLGGLALAFVAATMQVVFILVSRRGYSALPTDEASFVVLAGGFLGFLAFAVATGQSGTLTQPFADPSAAGRTSSSPGSSGPASRPPCTWSGSAGSAASVTGILALIEPVVGAVLAAVLLAETLRPVQLIGAAFVLVAALLLQRERASPADGTVDAEAIASASGDPSATGSATIV